MVHKLFDSKRLGLVFTLLLSFVVMSCSTENDPDDPETPSTNPQGLTIYKNQTGDPNADVLQAHYEDDDHLINIYGTFDSFNEPAIPKTVTFQKKNNDTIVNFIFDPYTSRISSSFISVRGEKTPIVMKFSYPAVGSDIMAISLYEYDWASQTGNMFFRAMVNGETAAEQNTTTPSSSYSERKNLNLRMGSTSNKYLDAVRDAIVVVAAGKAIIEAIAAVPAITAAVVAAVGVANAVAIGVAIVAISLAAMTSDANASELIPTDGPYPQGVPITNPVPTEEDPTPHLVESSCPSGGIGFSAYMDSEGSIGIGNISGGEYPFTYYVNGMAQEKRFFINDYPDGTYMVSVKDANGCIGSKLVPLTRGKSSGNGINLNGMFYPFNYVYVDYNIKIIKDEDYSYVRYAHGVFFSPEPIDFNNPDFNYVIEGTLYSDQPHSLPAGEYESNIGGFQFGKQIYMDSFTFSDGQEDFELSSIYNVVNETESTTTLEMKKRGYINLNWDGNQTSFNFHLYNEEEELVDGFIRAEMIEIELPQDE
ncbi:MAG: hypothetical protein WBL27_03140 [Salinimicrobium sp.]